MKKNIIFKAVVKNSNIALAPNMKKSNVNAEGVRTEQTAVVALLTDLANADVLDEPTKALFSSADFINAEKFITVFTLDRAGNTTSVPVDGEEIYVRFSPFTNRDTGAFMESYTLTGAPINTVVASEATMAAAMQLWQTEEETA